MLEQETKKREGIASISNVQKYFLVFRSPMTRKTHHPNSAATQSQDTRRNPS